MKNKINKIAEVKNGFLGVKYNCHVLRAETGKLEKNIARGHNLILDQGLDQIATESTAEVTERCHVGSGNDPFSRDSGSLTVSRAGNVLTASGSYFEADDVGRLYKFDSGEEVYINQYNSPTEAETVTSGAIAASEGTMWYVDRTALETQETSTDSVDETAGMNETTLSAGVVNHKRTHQFAAVGAGVTYNEIGWSPRQSTAIFNGSVLNAPVVMLAGDILIVESNFEIVQSPQTSVAQTDVGVGGFNTTGDVQIESPGLASVNSNGSDSGDWISGKTAAFEANAAPTSGNGGIAISTNSDAFVSYGTNSDRTTLSKGSVTLGSYSAGSYFRDKSTLFSISAGNSSNLNSIFLAGDSQPNIRILLDNPQTKLNTQTLEIVFRISWDRVLTN